MLSWSLFFVCSVFIAWLNLTVWRLKKGYQPIYNLSPKSHQGKTNTVSFGGVAILLSMIAGLLFFKLLSPEVVWCMGVFVAFGSLGFVDDLMALQKKKNQGLTSKQKFILQWLIAVALLFYFSLNISPLSIGLVAAYAFVMVGASNACNLTDGLDGLLGGLVMLSLIGFYGWFSQLGLLQLSTFSLVSIVAILGFFIFNLYPAKQFMGDTGSLALGAGLAAFAIVGGNPWVLLTLGAMYVLETLSVIIQVAYFKKTQQRIFLMAPLHHHFELMGLSERKIVMLFWVGGALFLLGFYVGYLK